MLKTTGARLRAVRKQLKLNQEELAKLFGLKGSNAAISAIEQKDNPIWPEYLKILREKYNVSESYIQMGVGNMFVREDGSEEPSMEYGLPRIDRSIIGVRSRFQEQILDFQARNELKLRKDVALRLHLNETQLSGVMTDQKDITLPMLLNAHQHGKINLNYTASGEGGFYIGEGNAALIKRIEELDMVVEVLKENASLKASPRKKQA